MNSRHTPLKSAALLALLAPLAANAGTCKAIHADLVEVRTTEGCNPGLTFCYLGEVNGNHGLRGVSHFKADGGGVAPPTASPGFTPYSGPFQYRTAAGTLDVRETGLTNLSTGLPQSGAVTAYQQVVGGTGIFAGATGFLFVNGRGANDVIQTTVAGEICFAG